MEKEITTSFIIAQIKLKCRLVKLSRSYCVWVSNLCYLLVLACPNRNLLLKKRLLCVSKIWMPLLLTGLLNVRLKNFSVLFNWVIWKTCTCRVYHVIWTFFCLVFFFYFVSYKNVISEMHILLLNLSWVFCRFWSSRVGSFVCIFLYLA